MPLESMNYSARFHVPHVHDRVATPCEQVAAVWREGKAPDFIRMPREAAELLAGLNVPKANRSVLPPQQTTVLEHSTAACGQQVAVRRKGHAPYPFRVSIKTADFSP